MAAYTNAVGQAAVMLAYRTRDIVAYVSIRFNVLTSATVAYYILYLLISAMVMDDVKFAVCRSVCLSVWDHLLQTAERIWLKIFPGHPFSHFGVAIAPGVPSGEQKM